MFEIQAAQLVLVPEPVAAAALRLPRPESARNVSPVVLVADFRAGTFDTALVSSVELEGVLYPYVHSVGAGHDLGGARFSALLEAR